MFHQHTTLSLIGTCVNEQQSTGMKKKRKKIPSVKRLRLNAPINRDGILGKYSAMSTHLFAKPRDFIPQTICDSRNSFVYVGNEIGKGQGSLASIMIVTCNACKKMR